MNWPIDPEWTCIVCGDFALTWGFVNGECRCNRCHAQYDMRDKQGKAIKTPRSRLKPEYVEPAKYAWKQLGCPVDEIADGAWAAAFAAVGKADVWAALLEEKEA